MNCKSFVICKNMNRMCANPVLISFTQGIYLLYNLTHNRVFSNNPDFDINIIIWLVQENIKLRLKNLVIFLYVCQVSKPQDLQMNPKEFVHNTAYSVQLPYIAGLSL